MEYIIKLNLNYMMLISFFISFSVHSNELQFYPKVDQRGFIDVWKLRDNVIKAESYYANDTSDLCYPEESSESEASEDDCVNQSLQRVKDYEDAVKAFNKAWLPTILTAIKKGDVVAEVILLQCDTTFVLDRKGMASSCSEDLGQRKQAAIRLKEIGFFPAFVSQEEGRLARAAINAVSMQEKIVKFQHVLDGIKQGVYILDTGHVDDYRWSKSDENLYYTAVKKTVLMRESARNFSRAFSFPAYYGYPDMSKLALNRWPVMSNYLTWGPAIFDIDSSLEGGSWRTNPSSLYLCPSGVADYSKGCRDIIWGREDREKELRRHEIKARTVVDTSFERDLTQLLASSEKNIDRYLAQDARWGVFLVHRIGHHEFVPEGLQSKSHQLSSEWLGEWHLVSNIMVNAVLDRFYYLEWPVEQALTGNALVYKDGEFTKITVSIEGASSMAPVNVSDCLLRYSGGRSFMIGAEYPSVLGRNLGHLLTRVNGFDKDYFSIFQDVFSPFNVGMRYKQVLMQCTGAESQDSDSVRFLFLANDSLVEISTFGPRDYPLYIRRYQRVPHES